VRDVEGKGDLCKQQLSRLIRGSINVRLSLTSLDISDHMAIENV
jgi:hypothetical protein